MLIVRGAGSLWVMAEDISECSENGGRPSGSGARPGGFGARVSASRGIKLRISHECGKQGFREEMLAFACS